MSSLKHDGRPRPDKAYWRSLDDLADTPAFRRFVEREFPGWADEMLAPASRRNFLKIMGASMALAGMTACRWPTEEIVPFAHRPEGFVPGEPSFFATAVENRGCGAGLLVTSYDGRPVKIEGNPDHPASLGATSPQMQASLLDLYDPDRSGSPRRADTGQVPWADFEAFARGHFAELAGRNGRGLRVLAGASSSPSREALRRRWAAAFPESTWVEYEPVSRDNLREGARQAFGRPVRTHVDLSAARTIVSLDDDLLAAHPDAVRLARDFAEGRKPAAGEMSRLWVVEPGMTVTGAVADRRLPLRGGRIAAFAASLARRVLDGTGGAPASLPASAAGDAYHGFDAECADDLLAHRGRSAIVAGPSQPAEVHALCHLLNQALGNVGATVRYTEEPDPERPHHHRAIRRLAEEIEAGAVDTLLILDGNPLYDAPADLDLAAAFDRVPCTIQLAPYLNETGRACSWHLPRAHYLESWGDTRDHRGVYSVCQPLIRPLHGGRSEIELLALLLGDARSDGYSLVQQTFRDLTGSPAPGDAWSRTLHDGLLAGSQWPEVRPEATAGVWTAALAQRIAEDAGSEFEIEFREDPSVLDGRFANNGWLQELPGPLTKLTWDNAALIGPATAARIGTAHGGMVRVTVGDRSVDLPVFVLPGQADGSLVVSLGYGRTAAGSVGTGVGFDVYPLRRGDALDRNSARVEAIGGSYELATTQDHWAIDDLGARETERRARILVREIAYDDFRHDPEHAMHGDHAYHPVDLWKPHEYEGYKWGMAIDLNDCIGCNACIVACQAENNIPVVGKTEVGMGREMHWLRIDRYFKGDPESPELAFQPVTCHHCENAPCEQVCPVAATVHDRDGLNVMVYNRCVGTRYCANNCPYKVRRFNYFNNRKHDDPLEMMVYNPEVTVRSRGVMEKCTFCVQRINRVKIAAKNNRRPIVDGEITTACEQACPTRAITFGDLNDENSRVRAKQQDVRAYTMLEEINIRPRTRYLARVRNRGQAHDATHGETA